MPSESSRFYCVPSDFHVIVVGGRKLRVRTCRVRESGVVTLMHDSRHAYDDTETERCPQYRPSVMPHRTGNADTRVLLGLLRLKLCLSDFGQC